MRKLRWLLCLPAGFAASVVIGAGLAWFAGVVGGSSWYIWAVSGAGSASAFLWAAFRVAPERTPGLKWAACGIVGVLGAVSAAGELLSGSDHIRALTGIVMLLMAVSYAKMPVAKVAEEFARPAT